MDKTIEKKLLDFFSQYPSSKIKNGTVFLSQKNKPPGVFFLREGVVRQFLTTDTEQEVVTTLFKKYSFFPMSWVLGVAKTNYSYKALSDIQVTIAPKEAVITFLKSEPTVLFDLLVRILSGLDAVTTRMTYLMSKTAYDRIVLELLFLAKRFGKINTQTKLTEFTLIQSNLGNQTGLTRETVNREINKLKKQKLILFEKNILTIPSLQLLEETLL